MATASNGKGVSVPPSVRSENTAVAEEDEDEAESVMAEHEKIAHARCPSSSHSIRASTPVSVTQGPPVVTTPETNQHIVTWAENDAENPVNWSRKKKLFVVFIGVLTVLNSTLGSSLPSNAIPFISSTFHITSTPAQVLPISVFLIGYIFGPLVFGPLSEHHGRRSVSLVSFLLFTVFTLACALAPTFPSLLVFRLLAGIPASSPVVITGGLYADIYPDPVSRGRAMAFFMAATCFGPLISPILSGFVSTSPLHWRWSFWTALIFAALTWLPLLFLPETYSPVLLSRRAAALRKASSSPAYVSAHDLARRATSLRRTALTLLARPLRMLFLEPIVLFTSLYLSLAYAIFYMYFEAYPIIFHSLYGLSAGLSGLAFLPLGAGSVLAVFVFLAYDGLLRRARAAHRPWARSEEARRLPLACLGGPLCVLALFWLGWASRPALHWAVPMMAGLPFGMGFLLIFMALLNYLTDAYEVYAASALAATSMCRSVFGAVLPLAAEPMYASLGIAGASSLLAGCSLAMCVIPFAFLRWGGRIRGASRFCQELKREKEEVERKKEEEREEEEKKKKKKRKGGDGEAEGLGMRAGEGGKEEV